MKRGSFYILGLFISLVLSSCDKDSSNGDFTLTINAKAGSADFVMDQPLAMSNGHVIKYSLFNLYIDNVSLIGLDSSLTLISEVELVNFPTGPSYVIDAKDVPTGIYLGVAFGLGLDSAKNMSDPNTYPIDHPLSILQGTYWDWRTMYRFTMSEGQFDSTGTGTQFDMTFSYHPGLNEQYRQKMIFTPISIDKNGGSASIELDILGMLEDANAPVDMVANRSTHCATPAQIALAADIMDNLVNSISN